MSTFRLLFLTDRSERHQKAAIKAAPPDVEVIMKRRPSDADLMALLPTVDFIISERNQPITTAMITAAKNLKLILRLGSLSYDIDVETARKKGVQVSMQPVQGSIYGAEHLMMMIFAVLKRLGRSLTAANAAAHGLPARRTDENTFAFNWMEYTDIRSLYGKTVAIVGMGEIGVELARRLKPFGLAKLYYNKRIRYPEAVERELWLRYASMLDCVTNADVLVSLLPFNEKTDRSISTGTFTLMKPSSVLVHAGSGSVIDEQALVEALRVHRLAGAALDTFEYEPLQPTHSLIALARDPQSNLLLTPHTAVAYLPDDRTEDFGEIVRFIAQEPLKFEI
ncbi:MAG: NAD(P)-dependent oxidoreductase [Chloroflexota bacterium]